MYLKMYGTIPAEAGLPVASCLADRLFLNTACGPEGHDLPLPEGHGFPLPVGHILHTEPVGSTGEAGSEPTQRVEHSQSTLSPARW